MDLSARNRGNRANGAGFEKIFEFQARRQGFLVVRNELSARFIGPKKLIPVKSNLDWTLIRRDGAVAIIDTKCFADRFSPSQIDPTQLNRALAYEAFSLPSGFVVWHRKPDKVIYYSASDCKSGDFIGIALGSIADFDLKRVFAMTESDSAHL